MNWKLLVAAISCVQLAAGTSLADTIVSGDLIVRDGGRLYFPDGSFQDKAQMVGPKGDTGIAGPPNLLTIGTVQTGNPGTAAGATISGAAPNQVLNLMIPQGMQGPAGLQGAPCVGDALSSEGMCLVKSTIGVVTTFYCPYETYSYPGSKKYQYDYYPTGLCEKVNPIKTCIVEICEYYAENNDHYIRTKSTSPGCQSDSETLTKQLKLNPYPQNENIDNVQANTIITFTPYLVNFSGSASNAVEAFINISGEPSSKYSIDGETPTNKRKLIKQGQTVTVMHTSSNSLFNRTVSTQLYFDGIIYNSTYGTTYTSTIGSLSFPTNSVPLSSTISESDAVAVPASLPGGFSWPATITLDTSRTTATNNTIWVNGVQVTEGFTVYPGMTLQLKHTAATVPGETVMTTVVLSPQNGIGTPYTVTYKSIKLNNDGPLSITTTTLPSTTIDIPYSAAIAIAGGTSPYIFTISSGALPAGLTINASSGVISGTPTGPAGTSTFTVTVTDSAATQASVSQRLSITVISTVQKLLGGAVQGKNLNLTNTVSTFAGLAGKPGSINGTGSNARFYNPMGITTDGVSLFVADYVNNTIRQIVIATGAVATLAGDAAANPDSVDGIGRAARFNYPRGITTDGTNLYVTDSFSHTIRKIVIATAEVTTIAGSKDNPGYTNGTGTAAQFSSPYGITTDGTNLYVTDAGNAAIRKIDLATMNVTTLAGDSLGTFSVPAGITTDGTNLYVADAGFNAIMKVEITTGTVTTFAGSGNAGSADSIGTAAEFFSPTGVTTDGINLYVVDQLNFTIRKIGISTAEVTTIAGTVGTPGAADGVSSAATLNFPSDITTDGASLFLTDMENHTARKIQ